MNEILIPCAVLLFLIIVLLYPLVITLTKKKNLHFREIDQEGNLITSDETKKIFTNVKLIKNDEGNNTGLEFVANEDVLATYVTVFYRIKKKTYFKKYRLNFLKDRVIFLSLKKDFEDVSFYINQVNDEIYKDKFLLRLTKGKFLLFVLIEWLLSVGLIGLIVGIIFFNYSLLTNYYYVYGIIVGAVAGVLAICMFPVIYFVTYFEFEKYLDGGKLND